MNDTEEPIKQDNAFASRMTIFLSTSLAIYGLMRRGNYRAAFLLYPRGGGGLNLYQQQQNGQSKRVFAIDYHSFWDKNAKDKVWRLHYHRGESLNQIKKHRPYEGGW